jgi:hypothetical protein
MIFDACSGVMFVAASACWDAVRMITRVVVGVVAAGTGRG